MNRLHPSNSRIVGTPAQWQAVAKALASNSPQRQARAEAALREGRLHGTDPSWFGFGA